MKKIFLLTATIAFILLLAAYDSSSPASDVPGENQILDGAGHILDIPQDPESATIASVYAVSVPFIEALGLGDRVTAINVKSNFWKEADPALAAAGTVGRGTVDLEALAAINPSVLIHRSNDAETVDAVQRIHIPVLCITVEDMEDITNTLSIMGRYFGAEERSEEVIRWMTEKFEQINRIVMSIPDSQRKTVLVLEGESGRIAAEDMLQAWMAEKAGGKYVAENTANNHSWSNVGVEQVFSWNPEFIFTTSSTPLDYTIDELMTDSAWSELQSVKDGHIYQIPAKRDSWDIPGVSCVLGTMYMLHKMYPDLFSAQQLEQEISDYYNFMFHKTFDAEYLGYHLDQ